MNMDVVENIFPELHAVHLGFFNICQDTLRSKLARLLEHLTVSGFIVKPGVEEQLQDIEDVGTNLISELSVQMVDPASGVALRVVAYVDSEIADQDTFALDTMMGLGVYRVDAEAGRSYPTLRCLASAGALACEAKPHQDPAQKAFAELTELNVEAICETAQSELTP